MAGVDVLDCISSAGGLVTVCCHCGRVRTREGFWVEQHVPSDHSVSHGICRACLEEFYPDVPLPPTVR